MSPERPVSPSSSSCTSLLAVSSRFDLPSSDLTLQSSDKVLFKIHRINLEMHSQVFADAGGTTVGTTKDEIVTLSESSDVLELMLQFIYLQRQPDLRKVDFAVMKELAEAVEKYEIYSAMGVCCQRMRECLADYPIDVLLYSVRHKYVDLINESAEATLDMPPYTMLNCLPANIFAAWTDFHQSYHALLRKEFTRFGPTRHHRGLPVPCDLWHEHYSLIALELSTGYTWEGPASRARARARARANSTGLSSVLGVSAAAYLATGANAMDVAMQAEGRNVLVRLLGTLERRLAIGAERCPDCKRELGHWMHQTERDWRDARKFEEYL